MEKPINFLSLKWNSAIVPSSLISGCLSARFHCIIHCQKIHFLDLEVFCTFQVIYSKCQNNYAFSEIGFHIAALIAISCNHCLCFFHTDKHMKKANVCLVGIRQ